MHLREETEISLPSPTVAGYVEVRPQLQRHLGGRLAVEDRIEGALEGFQVRGLKNEHPLHRGRPLVLEEDRPRPGEEPLSGA